MTQQFGQFVPGQKKMGGLKKFLNSHPVVEMGGLSNLPGRFTAL
jgi:hypothetical protein